MASSEPPKSSTFFSTLSTRFNSLSNTLQKQTEESFPGALKRFNDFTQTVQQRVRDLPSNLSNPLESFEAERERFVKAKANEGGRSRGGSVPVAPWEGYGAYENVMKRRILELSKDKRNFLFSPPEDTSFQFDIKAYEQSAKAALQHDPDLAKMRFALVPQQISEPLFWRNYFYRVTLTKQSVLSSTEIDPSPMPEEEEDKKNETADEKTDEVLFDFVGDEDDEDDGKDEKQKIGANKKQEEAKAPTKEQTSSNAHKKKEEAHDEYEGMEEWERELRRAASEAL